MPSLPAWPWEPAPPARIAVAWTVFVVAGLVPRPVQAQTSSLPAPPRLGGYVQARET